jgi:hypothetical protein
VAQGLRAKKIADRLRPSGTSQREDRLQRLPRGGRQALRVCLPGSRPYAPRP